MLSILVFVLRGDGKAPGEMPYVSLKICRISLRRCHPMSSLRSDLASFTQSCGFVTSLEDGEDTASGYGRYWAAKASRGTAGLTVYRRTFRREMEGFGLCKIT